MRLSDAIRLGAMLRPQGFEALMHGGRSCALGAAFEAANVPTGWEDTNLMAYFSGVPLLTRLHCPSCGATFAYHFELEVTAGATLAVLITHLNDIHRWTREQIADWVETLEAREAVKHDDDDRVARGRSGAMQPADRISAETLTR